MERLQTHHNKLQVHKINISNLYTIQNERNENENATNYLYFRCFDRSTTFKV